MLVFIILLVDFALQRQLARHTQIFVLLLNAVGARALPQCLRLLLLLSVHVQLGCIDIEQEFLAERVRVLLHVRHLEYLLLSLKQFLGQS